MAGVLLVPAGRDQAERTGLPPSEVRGEGQGMRLRGRHHPPINTAVEAGRPVGRPTSRPPSAPVAEPGARKVPAAIEAATPEEARAAARPPETVDIRRLNRPARVGERPVIGPASWAREPVPDRGHPVARGVPTPGVVREGRDTERRLGSYRRERAASLTAVAPLEVAPVLGVRVAPVSSTEGTATVVLAADARAAADLRVAALVPPVREEAPVEAVMAWAGVRELLERPTARKKMGLLLFPAAVDHPTRRSRIRGALASPPEGAVEPAPRLDIGPETAVPTGAAPPLVRGKPWLQKTVRRAPLGVADAERRAAGAEGGVDRGKAGA